MTSKFSVGISNDEIGAVEALIDWFLSPAKYELMLTIEDHANLERVSKRIKSDREQSEMMDLIHKGDKNGLLEFYRKQHRRQAAERGMTDEEYMQHLWGPKTKTMEETKE